MRPLLWTSGLSAEDVPRKYCSNESRKFQDPSSGKFHMLCEFLGEASVNVTEADLFVWSRSDLSTARVTTFSRGPPLPPGIFHARTPYRCIDGLVLCAQSD